MVIKSKDSVFEFLNHVKHRKRSFWWECSVFFDFIYAFLSILLTNYNSSLICYLQSKLLPISYGKHQIYKFLFKSKKKRKVQIKNK
jgi:hypothetical protein